MWGLKLKYYVGKMDRSAVWGERQVVFGSTILHVLFKIKHKIKTTPFNYYLLTYSMQQSPSWEANRFAASQEIPRISRNLKVYYCIHKYPPPVAILSHLHPVRTRTCHFLNIHLSIIPPYVSGSTQRSLSFRVFFFFNLYRDGYTTRVSPIGISRNIYRDWV